VCGKLDDSKYIFVPAMFVEPRICGLFLFSKNSQIEMKLILLLALPFALVQAQCGTANSWTFIVSDAELSALSTCTALLGSLSVSGSVSTLEPLANLLTIELALDVTTSQLTNLNGLGKQL
jgi:hypothetical protein